MRAFPLSVALLMAPVASAAEETASPPANWSGLYVGAEGAGAASWGEIVSTTQAAGRRPLVAIPRSQSKHTSSTAGLFGGLVGYNYQLGSWVTGIETDVMRTPDAGAHAIATGRLRLGYALGDVLLYVTAGGATQKATLVRHVSIPGRPGPRGTPAIAITQEDTQRYLGYAAGAGIEYKFAKSVGIRLEGLYLGEGHADFSYPAVSTRLRSTVAAGSARGDLEKAMGRVAITYSLN